MKSVTFLLLTFFLFGCGGHDLTDQEEAPYSESFDSSAEPKQAAAAAAVVSYTTKMLTDSFKMMRNLNLAQDKASLLSATAIKRLQLDSATKTKQIADLIQANVNQAKTNKSFADQFTALPKSSQDSVLKLVQTLQASSASYYYRLEDQNNRLYQLKYNDSVKNIGLNYVTGKAWDTERRLNAYTSKTDSLMVSVDLSQFTIVGDKLTIAKWQTLVDALKKFGINL